ncbi:MAG: hypothetical protein NVS9B5_05330 [Terriglobales bacterium]
MRELEALAPYAAPGKRLTIEDIFAERKWVEYYGGTMAYRKDNAPESALAELSPDYTDEEIPRAWEGNIVDTYLAAGGSQKRLGREETGLSTNPVRRPA